MAIFVCYFVFDWWGVSTAAQIRLYAGLLSVLPLRGLGCRCTRTALILREAGLPTKTSWEKGKGGPAPDSTTGGNVQLSREMGVGDYWEACASECRIRWCLTPIPRRRSLMRGNDISEEPMTQRWNGGGMVGRGRRRESRTRCRLGLCFHQGTPAEHTSQ